VKPTGRKVLPDDIPRVEIEILPDEVQRAGPDAFDVSVRRIAYATPEACRPRSALRALERGPAIDVLVEQSSDVGPRAGGWPVYRRELEQPMRRPAWNQAEDVA
jgi:hypothetical protein